MNFADFSIIYQDHYLLIVNKPAGVVVHPTYKHADDTLWDALLSYSQKLGQDEWRPAELPDEPGWEGAPPSVREMLRQRRLERLWREDGLLARPALLHRLDKDTSGVIALARTERARYHIVKQFQARSIHKRYLAVVRFGAPDWAAPRVPLTIMQRQPGGQLVSADASCLMEVQPGDELLLDGPLQRDPDERRRCIVGPEGQTASTAVHVLATDHGYSLLEVHPITGRTHQIRAHLAALGYPIVGDQTYALPVDPADPAALPRQFLHAYSLTLARYPDNVSCTFIAPLAADLYDWLERVSPLLLDAFHHLAAQVTQEHASPDQPVAHLHS